MKTIGELRVAQPFPWVHMLAYLAPRLIPVAECVTADAYVLDPLSRLRERGGGEGGAPRRRSPSLRPLAPAARPLPALPGHPPPHAGEGQSEPYCRYERRVGSATLRVELRSSPVHLHVQADGRVADEDVLQRVARLFDVADGSAEARDALRDDPLIGPRLARVPGVRPLGAWCPFELCVRTVLGQQVTVAAAGTLMRRLVDRCGALTPASVLAADLSAMGMPGKRVDTIRSLATAFADNPRLLEAAAWPQTESALRTVAGIGPWTLAYLAIRLGRQADAFPHTDIGLLRAAGASSPAALLKLSERWRPHRALAAIYLWSVP
jgi:DNA-3-methyladenine glycosylase II